MTHGAASAKAAAKATAKAAANGHETDLEMSPGPLDTTIFEKKCVRTSCKRSHRSEPGLKIRLYFFWDHILLNFLTNPIKKYIFYEY